MDLEKLRLRMQHLQGRRQHEAASWRRSSSGCVVSVKSVGGGIESNKVLMTVEQA